MTSNAGGTSVRDVLTGTCSAAPFHGEASCSAVPGHEAGSSARDSPSCSGPGVARLIRQTARLREVQTELAGAAVAAERSRVARDMHGMLGHSLTVAEP